MFSCLIKPSFINPMASNNHPDQSRKETRINIELTSLHEDSKSHYGKSNPKQTPNRVTRKADNSNKEARVEHSQVVSNRRSIKLDDSSKPNDAHNASGTVDTLILDELHLNNPKILSNLKDPKKSENVNYQKNSKCFGRCLILVFLTSKDFLWFLLSLLSQAVFDILGDFIKILLSGAVRVFHWLTTLAKDFFNKLLSLLTNAWNSLRSFLLGLNCFTVDRPLSTAPNVCTSLSSGLFTLIITPLNCLWALAAFLFGICILLPLKWGLKLVRAVVAFVWTVVTAPFATFRSILVGLWSMQWFKSSRMFVKTVVKTWYVHFVLYPCKAIVFVLFRLPGMFLDAILCVIRFVFSAFLRVFRSAVLSIFCCRFRYASVSTEDPVIPSAPDETLLTIPTSVQNKFIHLPLMAQENFPTIKYSATNDFLIHHCTLNNCTIEPSASDESISRYVNLAPNKFFQHLAPDNFVRCFAPEEPVRHSVLNECTSKSTDLNQVSFEPSAPDEYLVLNFSNPNHFIQPYIINGF